MFMWDEAEKISFLGCNVYAFGLYAAIGIAAALLLLGCLSVVRRCVRGTGPLLGLFSIVLGTFFSRLAFCLMNRELGFMMPLHSWVKISGGGWSMFGALGGVLLAAGITGKLTRQKTGKMLDMVACAFPLFIAAERWGERFTVDFDISRPLENDWLKQTFLAVSDEYDSYLATYRLAAILAAGLCVILLVDLFRNKRDGKTFTLFLLLFGAGATILESLRYDRFLSISFVGLQQVLAILVLCVGVLREVIRIRGNGKMLAGTIVILLLTAAIGVGLEFALDRTTFSRELIYVFFVMVLAVPVTLGARLREKSCD